MQSMSATTATTTLSARPRQSDALSYSHNHNRNHGPTPARVSALPGLSQPLAKPVQPASSRDFHLDIFFSPVWMPGPHVFSFAKDGTVVPLETYSGYRASAKSSSGRNGVGSMSSSSSSSSSPSFSSAPVCNPKGRIDKDWKNVAISEQDDAEFAAMEAQAVMRAQAEAKGKLVGLVYTWPPKPLPAACAACEVLVVPRRRTQTRLDVSTGTGMSTQEGAVPALSNGSSGEPESEEFRMGPGERDVAHTKEVPLVGSVEIGKLPRVEKVPGPALVTGMEKDEGESGRTLSRAPCGVREGGDDGGLSPLTAVSQWVEDQLAVSLKAMLRMHEV